MLTTAGIRRSIFNYVLPLPLLISVYSPHSLAEDEMIGTQEFLSSCASCHGMNGRGNGPMAKFLTVKPSDLTLLAKNNTGQYPDTQKGGYPFYRVFQVIDGRTQVAAHGDRTMPVWGRRYREEAEAYYGPMGAEKEIRARILELVYYIQSLQR